MLGPAPARRPIHQRLGLAEAGPRGLVPGRGTQHSAGPCRGSLAAEGAALQGVEMQKELCSKEKKGEPWKHGTIVPDTGVTFPVRHVTQTVTSQQLPGS